MNKDVYRIERVDGRHFHVHKVADDGDHQTYKVTYTKSTDHWHCDCRGFWIQKDKTQHKHCVMTKFWVEHLDEDPWLHLWIDKYGDIEYQKVEFAY